MVRGSQFRRINKCKIIILFFFYLAITDVQVFQNQNKKNQRTKDMGINLKTKLVRSRNHQRSPCCNFCRAIFKLS